MNRTLILTDKQETLRCALLSSLPGPAICRVLKIKPSQLANRSKDVYTKLGYRSRLHMLACELELMTSQRNGTYTAYMKILGVSNDEYKKRLERS